MRRPLWFALPGTSWVDKNVVLSRSGQRNNIFNEETPTGKKNRAPLVELLGPLVEAVIRSPVEFIFPSRQVQRSDGRGGQSTRPAWEC
jgi:hypothetical protein